MSNVFSADEKARLNALHSVEILDTPPDQSFDRIARLAASIFGSPIASVSFLDEHRQWFKSRVGLEFTELPRDLTFCAHAILSDQILVVPDATADPRFAHHSFVTGPPHVRFYAGAPLIDKNGHCLGTVCVVDLEPRPYPESLQLASLQDLAAAAMEILEFADIRRSLAAAHNDLLRRERQLNKQRRRARNSERRADLALRAGGMGIWEWDRTRNIVHRSAITEKLLGYEPGPFQQHFGASIHPDDRTRVLDRLQDCCLEANEIREEYRVVHPNGSVRWLCTRAQHVPVPGREANVVGVSWDITDQKHQEEQIRQSQELERGLNAASPLGIFRVGQDRNITYVNKKLEQLLQLTEEQIKAREHDKLICPEHLHKLEPWRQNYLSGEEVQIELAATLADGQVHWFDIRSAPLFDSQGKLSGTVNTVDDITVRKRAEENLQRVQNLLQLAIDTMPQRVFWKDRESRYLGCNQAFAIDAGYRSPAEVIGKSDADVFDAAHATAYRADDRVVMFTGSPRKDYEETVPIVAGGTTITRTSKIPLRDHSGAIVGVLGTYEDISAHKRREDELRRAKNAAEDAARTKGQFLANMSHEIRTPLNGVLGMVTLLLDSPLNQEQRQWAETAQVSGEALLRLLNNVLDLSKAEAGKITIENLAFNLRRTVEQCAELLHSEAVQKGLTVTLDYPPSVPDQVVGDSVRIRQVLLNFLANAVKFTSSGSIVIKVRAQSPSASDLRVHLSVQDSGIGVPPGAEGSLFKPFSQADGSTTRRFGGTGLGLFIAKQLCELMGGTLGYTANPRGGSIFWADIPLRRGQEVIGNSAVGHAPVLNVPVRSPHLENRRVLLAEDNPVNRMVATRMVEKLGCKVEVAHNGAEAVERWRQTSFDLVLMDGQMPDLDGYGATQQIRQLERAVAGRHTPIIALTAHALPGDKERCLAAGMDDYLSKPLQLDALKRVLEFWLPVAKPSA